MIIGPFCGVVFQQRSFNIHFRKSSAEIRKVYGPSDDESAVCTEQILTRRDLTVSRVSSRTLILTAR